MHSTAPVFSGAGDRVGERRLPVWKLQEEGVVLTVLSCGELAVDHTSTFVWILSYNDAHVAKREKVVDIILQAYRRHRCFLLEGTGNHDVVDTICSGTGDC